MWCLIDLIQNDNVLEMEVEIAAKSAEVFYRAYNWIRASRQNHTFIKSIAKATRHDE